MIDEFVYHEKPWPSAADYFWIGGYFFFFAFSFFYLKSFKKVISKKMIIYATLIPITVLWVTLYVTYDSGSDLNAYEKILAGSYPVLDTISLVPIIFGLVIFYKGDVSFSWTILFLGMLCFVISDLGFMYFTTDNSYYTGHPIDIPYLWAYILFSFGIYNHLKTFSGTNKKNPYHDQENLR
jgi:hypothetical protein